MIMVITPATSAVTAATAVVPSTRPSTSGHGADDERVQDDDVRHREERRESTAYLTR